MTQYRMEYRFLERGGWSDWREPDDEPPAADWKAVFASIRYWAEPECSGTNLATGCVRITEIETGRDVTAVGLGKFARNEWANGHGDWPWWLIDWAPSDVIEQLEDARC